MRGSWDFQGDFTFTIDHDGQGNDWGDEWGDLLPVSTLAAVTAGVGAVADAITITIPYHCEGYYDSGTRYRSNGDPGDAPEGDSAITDDGLAKADGKPLPKELTAQLWERYYPRIEEKAEHEAGGHTNDRDYYD